MEHSEEKNFIKRIIMQVAYQWMTNPTLIGTGAIKQLGTKAKEFGISKVLVVTDPGIEKSRRSERAAGTLKASGN